MAEDLQSEIEEAAANPAEAHGDQGGVKQQPLGDLIAADKHLRRTAAAARSALPFRVAKLRPPGAV